MIKINGKVPVSPKVRTWRELEGFNPLENGKIDVEGTIKRISLVYGLSEDEISDALDLADLLPTYVECVKFVNNVVFEKLKDVPKNVEGDRE